ncbi:exodeoxyribonuclease [Clostridium pasteurianum DSM 525 = ATCC 6013]|uniref:Exodeoxyribonuclease n=1 Tax=Clostridium pasteurianum DSM 525 = ATCC 6013 TaxID=1262449 RepID=A0A0H3J560_CLOPA|nr:exodeoxyribonuclease III [Clostridium pasteurianum]AJA48237.1 exodeoxyribonuclease [Clostridium pasteurianum DSM 525 = ATCC 6013]AJA52225.1 exodeoxyribonuclease [Clostridium pasteurianum DSM 525 = ATCC 6013]AOZ75495.1 exodeoxyribonuclease III [Clostridium pasteurianum DSM 525 = ATCC 6013]AOZ79290.1 exodeoxyribonuclease III [Clostridium pasteurianum]ELP60611.1 exodeoxyribonuclease III [Clostridium pasteurianum DSM 525 = ATCC 6013]
MKIYSWNVNGLRAVSKKGFFEFVSYENPDILCIQETKLQLETLSEELKNIKEYYSYFSFAERKGYSGVATYTKKKPVSIKHGIGIEKFDKEGRILITEFNEFILFNIYFPNGQKDEERLNYKLEFYDALFEYLDKLKIEDKKIIICGDYNIAHREIDIKNAKANEKISGFLPIERKLIDKFISKGYVDTFRSIHREEIKYSWWSYRFKARERNAGWRIDYFLVTENLLENVKEADILNDVMGSDHCPVSILLDI